MCLVYIANVCVCVLYNIWMIISKFDLRIAKACFQTRKFCMVGALSALGKRCIHQTCNYRFY